MKSSVLGINPGGGSTKIGLFHLLQDGLAELVWSENLRHEYGVLSTFANTSAQLEFRRAAIEESCRRRALDFSTLAAVVGRGGPLKPLPGGIYQVATAMLDDIKAGKVQADHPSLLGAPLAFELAAPLGIPAYIVDPVCTDEMLPEARLSGHPEISRRSLTHALNIKAMCRAAARRLGKTYRDVNLVAVHLGSGVSVTAHRCGRMIDLNDSSSEGPFGTQRCGGLPARELVGWMMKSGAAGAQVQDMLMRKGGLAAYIGSDDFRELLRRIDSGDNQAQLIYQAFLLQVKKETGAYCGALEGQVDAVVIGGGMAQSERLMQDLRPALAWIAPVLIFPGEDELQALAEGAARALLGLETVRDYSMSPHDLDRHEEM